MISSITWAKAPVDLEQALTRGLAEQLWLLRQQADLSATRGVGYRDIQGIRGYYTLPVPPCCCAVQVWQRYPIHVYTVYRAYPGSIAGPRPDGPTPRIRPDGPVHLPRTVRTYPCWARKQVLFSIAGSQASLRCGRATTAKRQGRPQQWTWQCAALATVLLCCAACAALYAATRAPLGICVARPNALGLGAWHGVGGATRPCILPRTRSVWSAVPARSSRGRRPISESVRNKSRSSVAISGLGPVAY